MPAGPVPRVLVADDQSDVLEALRLLLRQAGFEADCVSSVQSVRERLDAGRYDLLLMDLNYARDTTSGREGLDLLAAVRGEDDSLPVIVMTGWGSIDTAVEAMRLGARAFVQKPWDNTTLVETIAREIADGRAARHTHDRAARELAHARAIQRALLPDPLPPIDGCEVAAVWRPAGAFGGDSYDAGALGDGRTSVSMADVAGKGLPAALVMAHVQACARAFGGDGLAPCDLVTRVNRSLCDRPGLETFVTFCYLVVDPGRRTLTVSNAGHNPPLLVRRDGTVVRLATGGTVLGLFADAVYEQQELALCPGDRIVLFTDGLTEARCPDGTDFGDARLVDAVVRRRHLPARDLLAALFQDVTAFAGDTLDDDATLMVIAASEQVSQPAKPGTPLNR